MDNNRNHAPSLTCGEGRSGITAKSKGDHRTQRRDAVCGHRQRFVDSPRAPIDMLLIGRSATRRLERLQPRRLDRSTYDVIVDPL